MGLWNSDVDETRADTKPYFERALELVGNVADKHLEADIRHNFGFACLIGDESSEAAEHLQVALRLHRFSQDTDQQIVMLLLLAQIAREDRIQEALSYVQQAMQLAQERGTSTVKQGCTAN